MTTVTLTETNHEPYTAQLNPAMCTEAMKTLIGLVVKQEETTESAVIRHAVGNFLTEYFRSDAATTATAPISDEQSAKMLELWKAMRLPSVKLEVIPEDQLPVFVSGTMLVIGLAKGVISAEQFAAEIGKLTAK